MCSVYVDDMRAPFGRMLMCHMIADTHKELVEMADAIGVARKWIQDPGNRGEHFDICRSKRAAAIRAGAKAITMHEIGAMWNARKGMDAKARYYGETASSSEGE